jgi:hypothetical protein
MAASLVESTKEQRYVILFMWSECVETGEI